jgi:hypothetical protein
MSEQAGTAPSARLWEGRAGREPLWNQMLQSAADPQFITSFLFSIIGLIASLCLAVLFDIPGAEALLAMPG